MIVNYDIIVIGGGASGFFSAINIAENFPQLKIAILERGKEVLSKVRVSGGGRCNVTHACFVPNDLVKYYPRGEKELKGPFNQFCSGDTIEWFEKHGVTLKIEEDGRMFPITDSSQTIIDCFLSAAKKNKIDVFTGHSVQDIFQGEDYWKITTNQQVFKTIKIIMTTGSNPKMWDLLQNLGHTIINPVPSLFTFNIKDERIKDLMGVSARASVRVKETKLKASGPLLITHWGLSGPGILRLSAWGARDLFDLKYRFILQVNWLNDLDFDTVMEDLKEIKEQNLKRLINKFCPFDFPKRLWESLLKASHIQPDTKWADLSKKQLIDLVKQLTQAEFLVNGKSTFKEEFVTAGGIDLKEVNFKTMESKRFKNLYFAGEILNIDAITGGFNFQNAWTGGFIIAKNLEF
ncbi:flavoprotein [Flavobacterium covae]|uniref:NAD(P)/FAD-dependent oxidoreductase n=2 Tax=Flavobacterium TaxID=237 RepID=A0AA94F5H9_9FLAO|nr:MULTISPECIES: NAD(P)/FAD-dependent oxidoreductase [Flavobacterium]OXA74152.1 flavoprotein [Flavobacterium columnare] [Flavobacterium columnare NBRC 100251 = ATCC 23463]AND64331.1 flavoprotein [Flavobacterium covae]MCH4829363.1 NAD(P)/FAD-dependent oxidoreductase [Flavobacterium columnare]MCH4834139.1 NAD(P)/FAD-dependent oxidoreductase [Flavobacterium columnare]OWP80479.1 flavoprotein [Flavobacterium covae]